MRTLQLLIMLVFTMIFIYGCEKDPAVKNTSVYPDKTNVESPEPDQNETPDKPDSKEPEKKTPDIKILNVKAVLEEFIKKEAFKEDNPWLVAQGIKALGLEEKMPSGEATIEFLLKFLEQQTIKGEKYLKFRTGDYYDTLTDANPNMILKILFDQNADLNKQYETKFGKVTLKLLIHDAMMLVRPGDYENNEYANLDWTIEVLVDYVDPEKATWLNAYGETVNLKEMVSKNFEILKTHMKSIEQHYKNNMRRITKLSEIHSDIDGGAHLFWSTAKAVDKGFGDATLLESLREQAEYVLYRLKFEPFAYEAMHQGTKEEGVSDAERQMRLWAYYRDMLKFYAYQLESAQIIQKLHLVTIDADRQSIIDKSYENLEKLIALLHTDEMFKWIHKWNVKPKNINSKKHIVYHDIVADSCQALRVLNRK